MVKLHHPLGIIWVHSRDINHQCPLKRRHKALQYVWTTAAFFTQNLHVSWFRGPIDRGSLYTYHIKGTPTTKYCSLAAMYEKHLTTEPKHLVSNEQ